MKFTWSFNEIRDKPSSNGIRHRSSQRRPKLTLLLPLTRVSRYRITSDRWDVVWEIKYWGLRTINIIIFYLLNLLLLINKPNKEYSSLLNFFVFRNEFIDLVLFLARLRYPCYFTYERSNPWINTTHVTWAWDAFAIVCRLGESQQVRQSSKRKETCLGVFSRLASLTINGELASRLTPQLPSLQVQSLWLQKHWCNWGRCYISFIALERGSDREKW